MADNYNPNQPRAPKGVTTGGQWVKTPGGGRRAAGDWTLRRRMNKTWVPGKRDVNGLWKPGTAKTRHENTVEEDFARAKQEAYDRRRAESARIKLEKFKQGKREAAARFNAKEKAAHAKGIAGPATVRRMLRGMEAQDPNLRYYYAGPDGGLWEKRGGKWTQKYAGVDGNRANLGNVGAFKVVGGKWVREATGAVSTGGKHQLEAIGGGKHNWKTVRGTTVLAQEKHERHVAERAAAAQREFKERKNWAAKNLALRRKGLPQLPHPGRRPVGQLSPGGKNIWGRKRDKNNKMIANAGEWRLLPTEQRVKSPRPGQIFSGQMPRHQTPKSGQGGRGIARPVAVRRPAWVAPPRRPTTAPAAPLPPPFDDAIPRARVNMVRNADGFPVRVSQSGTTVEGVEDRRGGNGIFVSEVVKVQGAGKGILKTDGIRKYKECRGIMRGFAHREVAAYDVSQALGLSVVPQTNAFICADNPLEPGHGPYHSLQRFVDAKMGAEVQTQGAWNQLGANQSTVSEMLVLDVVLGNTDRHGNNWMIARDYSTIYAIDNGLCITETDEDAKSVMSDWRCSFKYEARKGGKFPIDPAVRGKLREAIDSGRLKNIIDRVEAHTLATDHNDAPDPNSALPRRLSKAVMARAESLHRDWYDIFKDKV
jgi:hypothetical protein